MSVADAEQQNPVSGPKRDRPRPTILSESPDGSSGINRHVLSVSTRRPSEVSGFDCVADGVRASLALPSTNPPTCAINHPRTKDQQARGEPEH
jgi:hypothetical protein